MTAYKSGNVIVFDETEYSCLNVPVSKFVEYPKPVQKECIKYKTVVNKHGTLSFITHSDQNYFDKRNITSKNASFLKEKVLDGVYFDPKKVNLKNFDFKDKVIRNSRGIRFWKNLEKAKLDGAIFHAADLAQIEPEKLSKILRKNIKVRGNFENINEKNFPRTPMLVISKIDQDWILQSLAELYTTGREEYQFKTEFGVSQEVAESNAVFNINVLGKPAIGYLNMMRRKGTKTGDLIRISEITLSSSGNRISKLNATKLTFANCQFYNASELNVQNSTLENDNTFSNIEKLILNKNTVLKSGLDLTKIKEIVLVGKFENSNLSFEDVKLTGEQVKQIKKSVGDGIAKKLSVKKYVVVEKKEFNNVVKKKGTKLDSKKKDFNEELIDVVTKKSVQKEENEKTKSKINRSSSVPPELNPPKRTDLKVSKKSSSFGKIDGIRKKKELELQKQTLTKNIATKLSELDRHISLSRNTLRKIIQELPQKQKNTADSWELERENIGVYKTRLKKHSEFYKKIGKIPSEITLEDLKQKLNGLEMRIVQVKRQHKRYDKKLKNVEIKKAGLEAANKGIKKAKELQKIAKEGLQYKSDSWIVETGKNNQEESSNWTERKSWATEMSKWFLERHKDCRKYDATSQNKPSDYLTQINTQLKVVEKHLNGWHTKCDEHKREFDEAQRVIETKNKGFGEKMKGNSPNASDNGDTNNRRKIYKNYGVLLSTSSANNNTSNTTTQKSSMVNISTLTKLHLNFLDQHPLLRSQSYSDRLKVLTEVSEQMYLSFRNRYNEDKIIFQAKNQKLLGRYKTNIKDKLLKDSVNELIKNLRGKDQELAGKVRVETIKFLDAVYCARNLIEGELQGENFKDGNKIQKIEDIIKDKGATKVLSWCCAELSALRKQSSSDTKLEAKIEKLERLQKYLEIIVQFEQNMKFLEGSSLGKAVGDVFKCALMVIFHPLVAFLWLCNQALTKKKELNEEEMCHKHNENIGCPATMFCHKDGKKLSKAEIEKINDAVGDVSKAGWERTQQGDKKAKKSDDRSPSTPNSDKQQVSG